jgi:capsular polysaccharide transport system permease protein
MLLRREFTSTPLGERIGKRFRRLNALFALTVILPTLLATIYFGFLASDVYESQSQFVVRSPERQSSSGLGVLLKSVGFANAGDEIFVAQDYVQSRDALRALNRDGSVLRAYTLPGVSIFDRFNGFGWNGSFEDLYDYFQGKLAVEHDTTSSITTLSVSAFTAEDALRMNQRLLEQSETLVNRLNSRGQADLVEFARREVDEARKAASTAAASLAEFRNRSGVIDPERQAAVQLQMISKLQDELIGARVTLQQLRAIAPQNPQIPVLQTRIGSLEQQIAAESGRVAGGSRSLSRDAVQYQRLQLEREFSDRQLASALASLQEARNEARRKQAYVERIVEPHLPDEALGPRRLRGIFATLLLGLVAYGVLSMLLAGVREHRD